MQGLARLDVDETATQESMQKVGAINQSACQTIRSSNSDSVMCFIFFEQMLQCKSSSPTSSSMTGLGSFHSSPDGPDGNAFHDHGIFSLSHSYSCRDLEASF